MSEITVLLIEDDEDEYVIIRDSLSSIPHSDFNVEWVEDFDAGLEAILRGKYDVCLLDYLLGDRDGLELIREATLRGSRIPIIFLTGWDNRETDLQAMKEGASDYLVKGQLSPSLLERSIRYAIERNQREKELLTYQNRLEMLVEERTAELVTAKNKAEKWAGQLSRSEERYRSIFENSMDGIMLTSPDGRILAANPEACRVMGYTEHEICALGRGLIIDETDPNFPFLLEERSRTGRCKGELTFVRKNGTKFPADISSSVFKDSEGQARNIVVFRDVTQHKEALESLHEREEEARQRAEELQKIMDLVPAAIFISRDPECRTIVGNQAANRFYESEEGENVSAGPGPGEQDVTRRFFRNGRELSPEELPMQEAAATGAEVRNSELEVLRPSGRVFTMLGNASPLLDVQGQVRGCVAAFMDITERKQMEEALREREEQYRLLFENMRDAFFLAKPVYDSSGKPVDWRFLDANAAYARMTGFPLERIIGGRNSELFPGAESVWKEAIARVAETGDPEYLEAFSESVGHWFSVNYYSPMKGLTAAITSDITERKRAEEELSRSEAVYRSIAGNFPNGAVYVVDRDLRFLVADGAALEAIGWSRDTLEGMSVGDLDEETRRIVEPRFRRVLAGESLRFETPYHGRIMVSDYVPIRDDHGEVIMGLVVSTDITESKKMEEALRKARDELEMRVKKRTEELVQLNTKLTEQKEILQKIVDNIPVMISFYHASGDVPMLNRYALEVMGVSPEELGQVDIMKKCYPDPEYRQEVLEYMREAPPGWKDIQMVGRDGKTIESSWANVRLSDGTFIGIGIDVTERKKAEEASRGYTVRLEGLNRDLEDFMFIAAHDLQEPLRKIQVFSDLVLEKYSASLDEVGLDYLERLASSANRMQELIRDVRAYSNVTTDNSSIKEVNLKKLVGELVTDPEIRIKETGARIQIGDLPLLEANPHLMRVLFQNLLGNAIKYRNDKNPVIRVSSREMEGEIQIEVGDNGIGFDEKYTDLIFKPFKRLHGRSEYKGTGMGLTICRKIVERHGGRITARSTPGKGSTFIIALPVKQKRSE